MNNSISGGSGDGVYESVSIAVITAVAAHRDVDPTELPPLYEYLDPDALDSLFTPTRNSGSRSGHLEFTYDGHAVVVDCADDVSITVDGSPAAESISASPQTDL